MRASEFNVSGTNQHLVVENPNAGLNPQVNMSIEVSCTLLGDGDDPTIISLPAGREWQAPFVAWRLGFDGDRRTPEFQVTIDGDVEPTTARARNKVNQYEIVHLAGTFDGSAIRLYVNGNLEAEVLKCGKVIVSTQNVTIGARSSTSIGGLLVGQLYEMRFWNSVRTSEQVNIWKDKNLPMPAPSSLQGLWTV